MIVIKADTSCAKAEARQKSELKAVIRCGMAAVGNVE